LSSYKQKTLTRILNPNESDYFSIIYFLFKFKQLLNVNFQEKYNIDSEDLYLFYQQKGINHEELSVTEEDFKS
jgi:hypothetical protein